MARQKLTTRKEVKTRKARKKMKARKACKKMRSLKASKVRKKALKDT